MRAAATLLLLVLAASASGAELRPFVESGPLGARIIAVAFPDTLRKELTSGLTNRLLIRTVLLADGQQVGQKAVEIAIRYDLWDESFASTVSVEDVVIESRALARLEDVLALLANLRLHPLFRQAELPVGRALTLRMDMLLNPIDRERMERIRKWVAENSSYTPGVTGAFGQQPSASTSSVIFNKIFEQYASGSDFAATWQTTVTSPPFRAESLPNERP